MLALRRQEIKNEYPRYWVPVLQNVVLAMQADIRTVEALCVALSNEDTDAGRVLEKLFEFFPRSRRVDGAIWKADGYFWTDHRINYRKMVRARRNLKPVVESWKQMAQGSSTWHYQLDSDALVLGIAQTLECSTTYVRAMILQNRNDQNFAEMVKSAKSITLDSDLDSDSRFNQQSKTVTEIEFSLIGEGLHAKTAAEFAGMNPLTVQRVIEATREMEAAGKIRKNKAAVLVTTLRREVGTLTPNPPTGISFGHSPSGRGEQDEYLGSEIDLTAQINPLDALESKVEARYRDVWMATKDQLEVQLDPSNFDTWLRDVRVIGFEAGVYVLAVRNEFALKMCEARLYRTVRRILQDAHGAAVEVRFEIAQPLTVN